MGVYIVCYDTSDCRQELDVRGLFDYLTARSGKDCVFVCSANHYSDEFYKTLLNLMDWHGQAIERIIFIWTQQNEPFQEFFDRVVTKVKDKYLITDAKYVGLCVRDRNHSNEEHAAARRHADTLPTFSNFVSRWIPHIPDGGEIGQIPDADYQDVLQVCPFKEKITTEVIVKQSDGPSSWPWRIIIAITLSSILIALFVWYFVEVYLGGSGQSAGDAGGWVREFVDHFR